MCGILGAISFSSDNPIDPEHFSKTLHLLEHRGPDAHSVWHNEKRIVYLGHSRLSVIDLSNGQQPMKHSPSGCVITYNGELYNYKELGLELKALGHSVHTDSDTEIVLLSYVQWGKRAFEKFNGIFALAIYDPRTDTTVLARDPLGIKPLYYSMREQFVFASELRPLALMDPRPPSWCSKGIIEYLCQGYTLAPHTVLEGIYQLPQGHIATIHNNKMTTESYFDFAFTANAKERRNISQKDCEAELDSLIRAAIKRQLVADVPVGIVLSGGVDSTLVARATQQVRPDVPAFTMDFSRLGYSELTQAQAVAEQLGLKHHVLKFDEDELHRNWKQLAWQSDAPIFDSSFPPCWALYKGVREHCTVALSGDGGDELFLGYDTYRADSLAYQLSAFLPKNLADKIGTALSQIIPVRSSKVSLAYKAAAFLRGVGKGSSQAHWSWRSLASHDTLESVVSKDMLQAHHPMHEFDRYFSQVDGADHLTAMSYVDIQTWLSNDIMVKADRASMAHGLELRVPLLDMEIASFALSLSDHQKFSLRNPKHLLRRWVCKNVPDYPSRSKKEGFGSPVGEWLQTVDLDWQQMQLPNFLDAQVISRLHQQHKEQSSDHSYLLWSLTVLGGWSQNLHAEHQRFNSPSRNRVEIQSQSDGHSPSPLR